VAHNGNMRKQKVLIEKPVVNTPLKRYRHTWKNNIVTCISSARQRLGEHGLKAGIAAKTKSIC
jgi:hypothetical protein